MRLPWKRRKQWRERLGRSRTVLWEKLREALASVVPIMVIVLILSFTAAPIPTETLLAFLIGAVMVILGIALFSLGADTAMTPIGERVGAAMTRSRKLWVVVIVGFLMGVIVTVSEPDLQVLAEQVPGVPNAVLVGAVAVGVGVFTQLREDRPEVARSDRLHVADAFAAVDLEADHQESPDFGPRTVVDRLPAVHVGEGQVAVADARRHRIALDDAAVFETDGMELNHEPCNSFVQCVRSIAGRGPGNQWAWPDGRPSPPPGFGPHPPQRRWPSPPR